MRNSLKTLGITADEYKIIISKIKFVHVNEIRHIELPKIRVYKCILSSGAAVTCEGENRSEAINKIKPNLDSAIVEVLDITDA